MFQISGGCVALEGQDCRPGQWRGCCYHSERDKVRWKGSGDGDWEEGWIGHI